MVPAGVFLTLPRVHTYVNELTLKATFAGLGLVWCLMGVIMCILAYMGSATKIWGLMGGAFIVLGALTALGARKL